MYVESFRIFSGERRLVLAPRKACVASTAAGPPRRQPFSRSCYALCRWGIHTSGEDERLESAYSSHAVDICRFQPKHILKHLNPHYKQVYHLHLRHFRCVCFHFYVFKKKNHCTVLSMYCLREETVFDAYIYLYTVYIIVFVSFVWELVCHLSFFFPLAAFRISSGHPRTCVPKIMLLSAAAAPHKNISHVSHHCKSLSTGKVFFWTSLYPFVCSLLKKTPNQAAEHFAFLKEIQARWNTFRWRTGREGEGEREKEGEWGLLLASSFPPLKVVLFPSRRHKGTYWQRLCLRAGGCLT